MNKIEVYYHLYIPFTDAAGYCSFWIDSILQKMQRSGLSSSAKVNVCITMPMHVYHASGVPTYTISTREHSPFAATVIEYLNLRYPWVHVAGIRDSGEINLYEGYTLDYMYNNCSYDASVLYIHSKGLYSACFNVSTWREVLEHFMIEEWKKCVAMLDDNDLVTVKDETIVNSGNIYWARGSYIKSLVNPLESHLYIPQERSDMFPLAEKYRYAFERWITSKNPRIDSIHEIKCNPYHDYWFLERVT